MSTREKKDLKAAIKRGVKAMAMAMPGRRPGVSGVPRSVILTYHSVGDRDHDMTVSVADFRAQVGWLAEHLEVIPAAKAAQGHPGVALTFDDGFRDNLVHAAPLLRAGGMCATVFVVAGRLGGLLDGERDPERGALMSLEELRELDSMGIEVGAHTLSHPRLSTLSESGQRAEIGGCKRVLEDQLGHAVEGFAYPFGSAFDYTEQSKALVEECGYRYGMSNRYGPNGPGFDPWSLRRIWIDRSDTLTTFQAKVTGRLDHLAWLDSPLGLRGRRILNRLIGGG